MIEELFAALRTIGKLVEDYSYAIEDGCVENLDYEPHVRGKNWIATVIPNRASLGGLDRVFWKHGSKRWYAFHSLAAGDIVEMAGDYYTGRGKKRVDRRYILVVRVEPDHFIGWFICSTAPSTAKVKEARVRVENVIGVSQ